MTFLFGTFSMADPIHVGIEHHLFFGANGIIELGMGVSVTQAVKLLASPPGAFLIHQYGFTSLSWLVRMGILKYVELHVLKLYISRKVLEFIVVNISLDSS